MYEIKRLRGLSYSYQCASILLFLLVVVDRLTPRHSSTLFDHSGFVHTATATDIGLTFIAFSRLLLYYYYQYYRYYQSCTSHSEGPDLSSYCYDHAFDQDSAYLS